ncbi:hypothetical protein OHA71_12975 [Streptomyces sp. NBC_00444]|uniref:hypothetical protein n=1 Tax=Streptomyces sp. NBC_00444 TaxID=2975744 RepID=UPI002E1A48FF
MKLVVQVKLLPTPEQAAALEATLHACNQAATWVSKVAFERGEFKNFALRKHAYDTVKSRYAKRPAGPETSTTRSRNTWWPRQNAPVAESPWKT